MDSSASRKFMKTKSSRRHKTSKRRKQSDSSSDESVDLSDKIFPISHYLQNKQEMIEQVFSAVDGEKLYCMLPPILKGMPMGMLKDKCLKELINMSDDEVRKVLCGEPVKSHPEKIASPPQNDSDSLGSTSLVVEPTNQEQDNRTLLDILEQEMQAIAYQSVLKRADNSTTDVTEVLSDTPSEVQACLSNKMDDTNGNVPLICLDSDDDLEVASSVPKNIIEEHASTIGHEAEGIEETKSNSPTPSISIEEETLQISKNVVVSSFIDAQEAALVNQSANQPSPTVNLSQSKSKSCENFLIQVFSSRSSTSERVVKKVRRPSAGSQNQSILVVPDSIQHSADCFCFHCKQPQDNDEKDTTANNNPCDNVQISLDSPSKAKSQSKTPNVSSVLQGLHDSSHILVNEGSNTSVPISAERPSDEYISSEREEILAVDNIETEEKEEGEITGEESEEDVEVLEPVQHTLRSPSIILLSDSNDEKSDSEHSELRNKVKKHHHRQRKSRRITESPERSRRCIERRGNRSYRRSAVTLPKENVKSAEEKNELSISNCKSLPCGTLSPVSSNNIISSTDCLEKETTSESDDSVPEKQLKADKAANANTCAEVPCSNSKNNTSKKTPPLSFSEEAEESENVEHLPDKTSWADRWAEKKDLKKVVITSKICRNVRKRLLSATKKQANKESFEEPAIPPVPPLVLHVEGSVQEYQMLQFLVSDVGDEESPSSDVVNEAHLSNQTLGVNEHLYSNSNTSDGAQTTVANCTSVLVSEDSMCNVTSAIPFPEVPDTPDEIELN